MLFDSLINISKALVEISGRQTAKLQRDKKWRNILKNKYKCSGEISLHLCRSAVTKS